MTINIIMYNKLKNNLIRIIYLDKKDYYYTLCVFKYTICV